MPPLSAQIQFLLEADALKGILRQTSLRDGSRRENSAEHSWHFALALMVLREHAQHPINLLHCLEMALVHDLVEIDAGDTFVYDAPAVALKAQKERQAAERIFALLPPEQSVRFLALWEEFEAEATPDARVAAAVDRLCPVLLNFENAGEAWQRHGVTAAQVRARNLPIMEVAPSLHQYVSELIDECVRRGYLTEGPGPGAPIPGATLPGAPTP